jgi:Na+/H+ antiporter NhaC
MIAAISKFFGGIKLWLYAAAAAAFAALLAYAKFEGHEKRKAQDTAAAEQADQKAADAQAAQQTYAAASDAVTKVQQAADKQPPPDPEKRDDFNTSF